jgi:hypothetical protein
MTDKSMKETNMWNFFLLPHMKLLVCEQFALPAPIVRLSQEIVGLARPCIYLTGSRIWSYAADWLTLSVCCRCGSADIITCVYTAAPISGVDSQHNL